jgi:3-oxoacyl-[acyl-carrier-protein] synthase-1
VNETEPAARAAILAAGLACGAGLGLARCHRAYAARAAGPKRETSAIGPDGAPPILGLALPFDRPRQAHARLAALLAAALVDIGPNPISPRAGPVPVALLLPAWAPTSLRDVLKAQFPPGFSDLRFVQGGSANSLGLLSQAARAIAEGRVAGALVCAVDSLANAERMDALMLNGAMYCQTNPYGIIPGEAAAAMLLVPEGTAGAIGRLRDVRTAVEPPGPLRGRGLAACLRALAPAWDSGPPAIRLLSDLSGPRKRAETFGVGIAAAGPEIGGLARLPETPALAIGDPGEAFGLVLACLTLGRAPPAYPDGDAALVVTALRPAAALVDRLVGSTR